MFYQIGDRVIHERRGIGTVRCLANDYIGVEFDNFNQGHNLRFSGITEGEPLEENSHCGWFCLGCELSLTNL